MRLAPTDHPQICVVGRTEYNSGIGAMSSSATEALSRSFPVCVLPTEPHKRGGGVVTLPSGRRVPVCRDTSKVKVWWFADVVWNGVSDFNFALVPNDGFRVVQFVFDSDELPDEAVRVLNRFDAAFGVSPHLAELMRSSGVTVPVGTLAIALNLDGCLSRPYSDPDPTKVKFLSVAAFHPRKDLSVLVRAFHHAFGGDRGVKLTIHSNLAFGNEFWAVKELAAQLCPETIDISFGNLSSGEQLDLFSEHDVYVSSSRGEGFGIGAREAMAMGKQVVLSAVGGHLDLAGEGGVHLVPPTLRLPARYPEIDNRAFGTQFGVDKDGMARALGKAREEIQSRRYLHTRRTARARAAQFSYGALAADYAAVIDGAIGGFRVRNAQETQIPAAIQQAADRKLGRRAAALTHPKRRIVPMHDGGYYSIFNVFMSNLVWDSRDDRCHSCLPDWDVTRFLDRVGPMPESFCYARPGDGNFWTKLYQPLFGFSAEEMNDKSVLYNNAEVPDSGFNAVREPRLTAKNAHQLYIAKDFQRWRREYHRRYQDHIALLPHLAAEVADFWNREGQREIMLAAHVRHPSHVIEQAGGALSGTEAYIRQIRNHLRRKGVSEASDSWGLFLATDQDSTVSQFVDAFGDHVSYFKDVRRTTESDDIEFRGLADVARQGHQVQHLTAANPANWSTRMAWEIVRDADILSRCQTLFHVVSNISTAVSYMNPDVELIYHRGI